MTDKNQQTISVPTTNTHTDESVNSTKSPKITRVKSLNHKDFMVNRAAMKAALKKVQLEGEKQAALVNNIRLHPLFQSNPCKLSTYTEKINRSFTDSLESYQNGANKKRKILQWNMQWYGREPKKEIVLHFLQEFSAIGIRALRKWIFYHLEQADIRAISNIELTREKPRTGKPNNRVHFHILTDDPRSKNELRSIFRTACEKCGLILKKDFKIDYYEINNGYWYFEYFTKYDRKAKIEALKNRKNTKNTNEWDWDGNKDVNTKEVIGKKWGWKTVVLFRKHTGLDKFKTIGDWFEKGKGQDVIWEEIQAFMRDKKNKMKVEGHFLAMNLECDFPNLSRKMTCHDSVTLPPPPLPLYTHK